MPDFASFRDAVAYYATLAHECTHWTRHPPRLARDLGGELGAAFLCADLGLVPQFREDHAPYIDGWLSVLKRDTRAIFTAAGHAQKALDFLRGLQPTS